MKQNSFSAITKSMNRG